jgi:hypothetical protein
MLKENKINLSKERCKMKVSNLIVPLALLLSTSAFAQSQSPANQLRVSYGEQEVSSSIFGREETRESRSSRVHSDYIDFVLALRDSVGNRPSSMHEFMGFSGAGYAEKDVFVSDFKNAVIGAVNETKARLGSNAVTVLVLGGTLDGFGIGYDIIDDLKKSGQIKDVVVAGMVSDQAVKYHMDGVKQGYDVISPKQDHILVMKTYTEGGNQTWELKDSKTDTSKTVDLLNRYNLLSGSSSYSVMHVMEGGEQAIKESMEMLVENTRAQQTFQKGAVSPEMRLYVGYREGKVAKMKGYKAATQMVRILAQFPQLKPDILKVTIRIAGSTNKVYSDPREFLKEKSAALVDPNFILSAEQKAQIPAEEAATRASKFQDAMRKTLPILTGQLEEGRFRLEAYTRQINGWLDNPSHPIYNSDASEKGALNTIQSNNRLSSQFLSLEQTVKSKIDAANSSADLRAQRAAKAAKGAGESVRLEYVIQKTEKSK